MGPIDGNISIQPFSSTFILDCTKNGFLNFLSCLGGQFRLNDVPRFGRDEVGCTATFHHAHRVNEWTGGVSANDEDSLSLFCEQLPSQH